MTHYSWTRDWKFVRAVVLVTAFALSGCGRPVTEKEQSSVSTDASNARAVNPGAGQSSAGLQENCVGMGCDGQVSAGLQEKCVGMGCPSDAE